MTNKRIIISHGFIGVDYKSLNLDAISSIDVRVDGLDKLVKPNTGTIFFASSAAPVYNQNNRTSSTTGTYSFSCIDNPYDVYKEVKELIEQHK